MTTLDPQDLYWCVRRLPKHLREMLQNTPHAIVGGGFIRACIAGEDIADIDVFADDPNEAQKWAASLVNNHSSVFKKLHKTDNAVTVCGTGLPIQFIHRWTYASAKELVASFDFTISCAAFWYDQDDRCWKSLADDRFYTDLASKRLVYRSPVRVEESGGSLLRVLKYYQRGYRIPLDSLAAVVARLVSAVDLNAIQQYDIESRMAVVLTGLLREVDPLIDINHLSHLPSSNALPDDEAGG